MTILSPFMHNLNLCGIEMLVSTWMGMKNKMISFSSAWMGMKNKMISFSSEWIKIKNSVYVR